MAPESPQGRMHEREGTSSLTLIAEGMTGMIRVWKGRALWVNCLEYVIACSIQAGTAKQRDRRG